MGFDIRRDLFSPDGGPDEDASREYIDTLFERFLASPEAEALPQTKEELGWVVSQLRLGIDYLGVTPPETSPGDLHEIVFEIFPRKSMIEASEAPVIVSELAAFWLFLEREFELDNAAACLEIFGDDAASQLEVELANPANFGPAKQFGVFSEQAGFDLTTEAGRAQAMLTYNATLDASRPLPGDAPAGPGASLPLPGDPFASGPGSGGQPATQKAARSKSRRKSRRRAAKASRRKNRKRR